MDPRLKRALEEALLRQTMTGPSQQVFLQHTPEVMGNQITAAKGASIALPAGAADLGGLAAMAASQPYAYAGPGAAALSMQAQQAGVDMGGLDHPPFSGDPIRELVGLDPEDPWGIAGEMLDPSAGALKGFALLLKAGMTALKTGMNVSGALAAMAPVAKVMKGHRRLAKNDLPEIPPDGHIRMYRGVNPDRLKLRKTGEPEVDNPLDVEDGGIGQWYTTDYDEAVGYANWDYEGTGELGPGRSILAVDVSADEAVEFARRGSRIAIDEEAIRAGGRTEALVDADTAARSVLYEGDEVSAALDMGIGENIPLASKEFVSTRRPTAVAATEDPVEEYLQVGLDAAQRDPKSFAKNVKAVTQYPNYRPKSGRTAPSARAEAFIEHVEDNLLWLHDQVPKPIRDRSAKWYDGTSVIVDRFGQNYPGLERRQYGGVIAVLSPQKDWFQNASLAERVLSIKTQAAGHRFDTAMRDAARRMPLNDVARKYISGIEGKRLDELTDPIQQAWWIRLFDEGHNPREYPMISPEGDVLGLATTLDGTPKRVAWGSSGEIGKAVSIIEDGSPANISHRLGGMHKVRSFNNNILDPNNPLGDVTIDTHAVAAALLRPLSGNSLEAGHAFGGVGSAGSSIHGVQGTYPLYAEAYRRAAELRGILPRQMQSITWEASRGLFTPVLKRDKQKLQQIDRIWTQYRKKQISINEARRLVHDIAEGIDPPEWHRLDTVLDATAQDPGNAGQLSGSGLRNTGRGTDPRAGAGTAQELTEEQLSRFDDRLKQTIR